MNNLAIGLTSNNLSGLISSGGMYTFIVDFLKSDGSPLNNSNVPNTYTTTVSPSGSNFTLNIPISPGNYTILGVVIVVYNNTRDYCCHVQTQQTIQNTEGGVTPIDGIMNGYQIMSKSGKTLLWHGTQDLSAELLESGNLHIKSLTTRKSFNNTTDVSPITCFNYLNDANPTQWAQMISPTGYNARSGKGLALTIFQYFVKPSRGTTLAQLKANNNIWDTFGNPATYESYSGQIERLSLVLL